MTATRGTAFTAAVRVVHRVHGNTANGRAHAPPAACAGLAELAQIVFAVPDFPYGCATIDMNPAHFAGAQPQRCVYALARRELC